MYLVEHFSNNNYWMKTIVRNVLERKTAHRVTVKLKVS